MNDAELRREFLERGAVVLPRFFEPDELAGIVREIDAYGARLPATHSRREFSAFETEVIAWHTNRDGIRAFEVLRNLPKLDSVTRAALGGVYTPGTEMVMFARKGVSQAWHQDSPPGDPSQFLLNRLIYVKDMTVDEGAVVFVPGSHKAGRLPPGGHQDPMPGEVVLAPACGTLVLLHSNCFHRVTPNLVDRPRVSVNFRVSAAGVPTNLDSMAVYRNAAYDFAKGRARAL